MIISNADASTFARLGLKPLGAPPKPGIGRALFVASNGDLYAVVDDELYGIDRDFIFDAIARARK